MKILIIRFSSIGDIVLTTPVIRCLKKQLPQSEIHFLSKLTHRSILSSNPYIDQLHLYDQNLSEIIATLRKESFDYIIDLHHSLRSFLVKSALKAKSYSFNKLNLEKWCMVQLKWNRLPDQHIVMRYLETVSFLGVKYDGQGLDYFIPNTDQVDIAQRFPQIRGKAYVAFVIGAAHQTKRLPTEKLVSLCRSIQQPILLVGGPQEKAEGDTLAFKGGTQVINTAGLFNINQSASIVQQAAKVIAHDTGLMHIAAAFDKEILSVWGNTIPAFGMYPFLSESAPTAFKVFEVKKLSCRPCSKIGYQKCPKKHFHCMNLMDINAIVDELNLNSDIGLIDHSDTKTDQ